MRTTEDTNTNDTANNTANDRCFRTVRYEDKGKDDD